MIAEPIPEIIEHMPTMALSDDREVVISVRNAGKMYRIYEKPQDRLKQMLFWRFGKSYGHEFWALRNVSFEVRRGETVGIIGRNGSGKSTLLQMIAGTLAPTEGAVEVRGRVAALLELGSGFNPEFTGRENVFLNGSILGLSREEMAARFDDIAAFADIGEFIEQPVKTYSSGMYARLAFSVAISIDPDILIVDEILAVGDMGFQQKCVARLRYMRDSGLTLLFVSHSPDAIKSVCQKGLFLINGHTVFWGNAERAVDLYFNYTREQANTDALRDDTDFMQPVPVAQRQPGQLRYGSGHVQIQDVSLIDAQGETRKVFTFGDNILLRVRFKSFIRLTDFSASFLIRDITGIDLMGTTSFDEQVSAPALNPDQEGVVEFRFLNQLKSGVYGISVALNRTSSRDYSDNILFDQIDSVAVFTSVSDPNRPVHYKFYTPVRVEFQSL